MRTKWAAFNQFSKELTQCSSGMAEQKKLHLKSSSKTGVQEIVYDTVISINNYCKKYFIPHEPVNSLQRILSYTNKPLQKIEQTNGINAVTFRSLY